MAYEEGLRRIRTVAKVLMMGGCGLLLVAVALSVRVFVFHDASPAPIFVACGAIGIYSSVLGGIILIGAWIVEGFVRPSSPPTQ